MSNRLGLRQLRAFHAVMTGGSITAAAEKLHLSQPTISKQLTALEGALNLKLFERGSGSAATPTRQGVAFFKAIEATIAGLDSIEATAQDIRGHGRRRIRIAATPPILNSTIFMDALHRFTRTYPEVQLALEAKPRVEIEDWAIRREIDLALALLPSANPSLVAEPLLDTSAVAVMHRNHPLASFEVVTPAALEGHRLILPSRQLLRSRIDMMLEREGRQIAADIESSSANTCCRLAVSGAGVTICDPFSPTAYFAEDVVVRRWAPAVRLTYGIIRHHRMDSDPVIDALMGILRDRFETFSLPITA